MQAEKITGMRQQSAEALYSTQLCKMVKSILSDHSRPLQSEFVMNSSATRLIQKRIRTQRNSNSFVPSAIRMHNDNL